MSTVKANNVQVGQSGTATNNFTWYQPTSPDGTVRLGVGNTGATTADVLIADSSSNLRFNSGYGSAATAYGCRAWVNFDGTTSPGTIRASGNVTSVSKTATGRYVVNFTNTLVDANYAFFCTTLANRGAGWDSTSATKSTTQLSVQNTIPLTSTNEDVTQFNVSVFR